MTDRYTKFVLTVIAGCLVIIAGRDLLIVNKAFAQTGGARSCHCR
jgi:preprotein translocase subunit SecE